LRGTEQLLVVPEQLSQPCKEENDRPIIGVLTQPALGREYVAGSYVKYLEAAGARVVALRYRWSKEELVDMAKSLNGLLLPGGNAELSKGAPYYDASAVLFEFALEQNRQGKFFPVWGTCLGFEQLHVLASGDNSTVLSASGDFDSEDFASPVTLTEHAMSSDLVGNMPEHLVSAMTREPITFNAHKQGISPRIFHDNPKLVAFFTPLATFKDRKGKPFMAIVEAKHGLPVYGTQFHPEKAIFEWFEPSGIPHTPNAILLAQYTANFFVQKARCSPNSFPGGFHNASRHMIQLTVKRIVETPNQYFAQVYEF
ncbi:Gamma-glutamyl hydrolase A (Conjugase A) (GH A) (Gamma-Glu-X carboxypeptidase A), partial [Durusdinium trenchii]